MRKTRPQRAGGLSFLDKFSQTFSGSTVGLPQRNCSRGKIISLTTCASSYKDSMQLWPGTGQKLAGTTILQNSLKHRVLNVPSFKHGKHFKIKFFYSSSIEFEYLKHLQPTFHHFGFVIPRHVWAWTRKRLFSILR